MKNFAFLLPAVIRWRGSYLCLLAVMLLLVSPAWAVQATVALPDFTELVERSAPAVVNISTTTHNKEESKGAFRLFLR